MNPPPTPPASLFDNVPAPVDDGACAHLAGMAVPEIALMSTDGKPVELSRLRGRTVVFAYPRTAEAGAVVPDAWKQVPGAFGCTAESCSFRDRHTSLRDLGVAQLFGLSTQTPAYQQEVAQRLQLTYPLISDAGLEMTRALKLPTFEFNGETLLNRFTLILDDGRITAVLYPVFPPTDAPGQVIRWLEGSGAARA